MTGVVALMHPDGEVHTIGAMGAGAASLAPGGDAGAGGPADLVWLAPSARECRSPGWLAAAVARLDRALASGGIAYVFAPPLCRGRLAAALRAAGFEVGAPIGHLGGHARDRFLFSLGQHEAQLLVATGPSLAPAVRRALRPLTRLPGWPAVAAELWPRVGFVARRTGSRPAWHWTVDGLAAAGAPVGFVAVAGWRGPDDSMRVHLCTGPQHAHGAVAKIERRGASVDEAAVLDAMGDAARAAGAAVPRVLARARTGGRRVVLLSALAGTRAWEHLHAHPRGAGPTLALVAVWLERWNTTTRTHAPLRPAEVETHLLAPLCQLAPLLPDGDAYAAHLRALAGRLGSRPLPRVATHGDLTMYNVLLAGPARDTLGVVDWEAARPDGWPLTDLEYAAVDIVAATGGYRDRVAAWRHCFDGTGAAAGALAGSHARLATSLDMPEPFAELCHHACWLHHAANEARAGRRGARPFLDILRLAAAALPPGRD